MKKIKFIFALLTIWALAFNANAILHMEIRGGQASGLPIGIVPFAADDAGKRGMVDFAEVIKSNLENSGQFKATPFQQIKEFPSKRTAVKFAYWKTLGVEDLVIGKVEKTAGSNYTVSFELLDVVRQNAEGNPPVPLLAMKFDNIKPEAFRALAHHISDLIFEKLIGVRGIFSTRIAYVSVKQGFRGTTHALEVADADGHNPKTLFSSPFPMMSPAWSPDGRQIAFVSFDKERASVNIIEVSTGRATKVTQFPGINGAPAWSPDGQKLALVLSKEGNPKIYIVDLASKKLSRLTDGTGIDTEPKFAPDGQSIVFTSNRGGKPQIYKVTLITGKVERLTFNGDYNASPSLTPDGKRLVMLHIGDDGLFSIAVQSLSTGELKVLTQTSLNDSPSLAPNGMMVLYGSEVSGRGVLGAVSLDGRIKIRLPAREGNVQEPAWSPFPAL